MGWHAWYPHHKALEPKMTAYWSICCACGVDRAWCAVLILTRSQGQEDGLEVEVGGLPSMNLCVEVGSQLTKTNVNRAS